MNEKQNGHPEEALSAYLDGELEPAERTAIEEHLRSCVACAGLLEDLRRLDAAAAEELPPPVPADLAGRISKRLAPQRVVEMPRRRWTLKQWVGPIPLAAAATLAAVAVLATVRMLGPQALREAVPPVSVADEELRPVLRDKGAAEDRDAARERGAVDQPAEPQEPGLGGAAEDERAERRQQLRAMGGRDESESLSEETGIGPERQLEEPSPAELKPRTRPDESRALGEEAESTSGLAPADAERKAREDAAPNVAYEMYSAGEKKGVASSEPKREKERVAAAPNAVAPLPEPTPPAAPDQNLRPSPPARLREAAPGGPAASEDDRDATRSRGAPERYQAEPTEPGTLSVLGETEGPGEARMLWAGAVARRTLTLEAPGYRIALTEDGDLEVNAAAYQCTVTARTSADAGTRAGDREASARPVGEKDTAIPTEIADLFRLAALLREATEGESLQQDRVVAKEAAESPWAISLVEPGEPPLRVNASSEWDLPGAGALRELEAREPGKTVTPQEAALQHENTGRHLAIWLAERIHTLAHRDYAALLEKQCGPLPTDFGSGD